MRFQIESSGILPSADGKIIEYVVVRPDGGSVEFDGFTHRGDPPVQVYQEFKGDYSFALKPWISPERLTEIIDGMVAQAQRQATTVPAGAVQEWFFATPEIADLVRIAFAAADGLDNVAVYVVR